VNQNTINDLSFGLDLFRMAAALSRETSTGDQKTKAFEQLQGTAEFLQSVAVGKREH
jgi:hypothetical protein